jgi:hypothetical protein
MRRGTSTLRERLTVGFTTGYYRFYYRLLPVGFQTGSQEIMNDHQALPLSYYRYYRYHKDYTLLDARASFLPRARERKTLCRGLVYTSQKPVVPVVRRQKFFVTINEHKVNCLLPVAQNGGSNLVVNRRKPVVTHLVGQSSRGIPSDVIGPNTIV